VKIYLIEFCFYFIWWVKEILANVRHKTTTLSKCPSPSQRCLFASIGVEEEVLELLFAFIFLILFQVLIFVGVLQWIPHVSYAYAYVLCATRCNTKKV
jgi:hypothetical protein